jgi:hypothetical protein
MPRPTATVACRHRRTPPGAESGGVGPDTAQAPDRRMAAGEGLRRGANTTGGGIQGDGQTGAPLRPVARSGQGAQGGGVARDDEGTQVLRRLPPLWL